MAVTVTDIQDCFPEFASTPTATISLMLAQAVRLVNTTQWGGTADDGTKYLTAHLLKLNTAGDGLAGGAVRREKVGDVEREYAVSESVSGSALASTAYGRHYQYLQSLLFVTRKL